MAHDWIGMKSPPDYNLPHESWRQYQYETVQWLEDSGGVLICEQPTGCHRLGQLIQLWARPEGTIKVEDIKIGDSLIGDDGAPRQVLSLIRGFGQMYEVIPTNYDKPFVVNIDHILTLWKWNNEQDDEVTSVSSIGKIIDVSVREYLQWQEEDKRLSRLFQVGRYYRHIVSSTTFILRKLGVEPFYGFSLSGNGRYLLDDFTVTHNSGKSAVAVSQSVKRKTITLVRTKNLQAAYGSIYGAKILMGKANYTCTNPEGYDTCDDCIEPGNMYRCGYSRTCGYLIAKREARMSDLTSVNYAYWLSTRSLREHLQFLVLDEAHMLPDIALNWAGATVHEEMRRQWGLPELPRIQAASRTNMDEVHGWFLQSTGLMMGIVESLDDMQDAQERAMRKRAERLTNKLRATYHAIGQCKEDWFVRSGPGVCYRRGRPMPGIIVRPLTAKYHWPQAFLGKYDTLLMSATIGNPAILAEELGITSYTERIVPNRFTPDQRPVFILDAPRMSYKSKAEDYQKQSEVIAEAILDCPSDWTGFIHVTRKTEARLMADRLTRLGLRGRIWVPPEKINGRYIGTNQQAALWDEHRDRNPGAICCSWQFWAGIDGVKEKISITAKIPFPSLGSPYEKARLRYNKKFYAQRTAWQMMQAAGRTRRGNVEDYDIDGRVGLVAIADGNWTRVRKYLNVEFLEAVRPWETA